MLTVGVCLSFIFDQKWSKLGTRNHIAPKLDKRKKNSRFYNSNPSVLAITLTVYKLKELF